MSIRNRYLSMAGVIVLLMFSIVEKGTGRGLELKKIPVVNSVKPQKSKNKPEAIYHTVKAGETIFGIGKKYKVSTEEIKKWNKLKGNYIRSGQKLIVGYAKMKKNKAKTIIR